MSLTKEDRRGHTSCNANLLSGRAPEGKEVWIFFI